MGSTEQQGIHTLTGDYLAAEAIARRVAERSGAYYIPVIPFGCSEYFRGFPGTISLRPSTVEAVITDVVQSLTEHGVTKLFFINGHAGNTPTIEDVARRLRREKGLTCFSIDLWQGLTEKRKGNLRGRPGFLRPRRRSGHLRHALPVSGIHAHGSARPGGDHQRV